VWGIELVVMLAMVAMNAVFAGYEISLVSVSRARLRVLAESRRSGATAAQYMKENVEASLAAVQLGITLFGAVAAATGGAGAQKLIAPWLELQMGFSAGWAQVLAIALVVVPLTFVAVSFGELVPKVFALRNKEWVCLRLSPFMWWFVAAGRPVVWLLETVASGVVGWHERRWRSGSREVLPEAGELQELQALAALARASRLIGWREEAIILGAAGLPTRPVREIVLPAEYIVALAADAPLADAMIAADRDMHTRFPVTEKAGDPQAIIGYVTFKDIVACARSGSPAATLREILRPIQRLADSRPITDCLEDLLRDRAHIALILDATDRVLGMITLEDILEELIGDIQDEYDRLPDHAVASGTGWIVGGGVPLARLKELTGVELTADVSPDKPPVLNDWVVGRLGRGVHGGETVEGSGLRVTVRKVRRHKVQEAQVNRTAGPQPAPELGQGGIGSG
jgi:putative hemolysin